jgi:uncharacterized protein (TIGR03067 family)
MVNPLLTWMLAHPALLVCVTPAAAVETEKAKAVKAELRSLKGEWRIIAAEMGGKAVESNDLVVFSSRKCTITNPKTKIVLENAFTIDPSKTPKQIGVTNTKTNETWVGIYELKGDRLRAVFQGNKGGKRPTEFKTRKGSLEVMYTYKRIKPK